MEKELCPIDAGAPEEESFEFVWGGRNYRMPLRALEKIADEIDAAANAYVTAAHCAGAVALFFSAMSDHGWKFFPPSSGIPLLEKTDTIERIQNIPPAPARG